MIRIVRDSPATLYATFYVDDTPTDVDAVTATVTAGDGSVVASGVAPRTDTGVYTFALPPQPQLTTLRAQWSGARSGVEASTTTYAEVVGSEYFSIDELRDFDSVLKNTTKYPTSKLRAARLAVENEFEGICGRSFVPRYAREVLYGDGGSALWLSHPQVLRVLSVRVNGDDWSSRGFTTTSDNLRVLVADASWPSAGRIEIEYEHGMNEAPIRIKGAAMKRAKYQVVADQSRIDERATTMNVPDFGNFVLATPGMRGSRTGIPEVDVVLADYELS